MIKNENQELIHRIEGLSQKIRMEIIELAYKAGKNGAHCGGSLSAVEILTTLYTSFIKHDPSCLLNRDRMIISKAHASLVHYCILESFGFLSKEELFTFEQNGSNYTVHAKKDINKGIEFSGGSLGLGISYACGVAYACKIKNLNNHIYVLLGDGECNEGIVWEALMFAKHYKLNNLTAIVDHNHLQADGSIEDVLNTDFLTDKFSSFGFKTKQVDGHSVKDLFRVFNERDMTCPNAIIAETIKGKGVSFMENKYNWHFATLPESKYNKALSELTSKQ